MDNRISGYIPWALSWTEAQSDAAVSVRDIAPAELSRTVDLGEVSLDGPDTKLFKVDLKLSRESLPQREFGDAIPPLRGEVTLRPNTDTMTFPEDGMLDVSVDFRRDPLLTPHRYTSVNFSRYGHTVTDESLGTSFVIPNRCEAGTACALTFWLEFTTESGFSDFEGGRIELEPSLQIELDYGITGSIPARARLLVEQELR